MSSQVYNCLVVDDEPLAREVIKRYIQKLPILNLAGECSNALQVISLMHEKEVDIIFLDIRMPQLTGLELVSTLANPPKIIFTTAYEEYALASYDLNAVDYLLKPIQFERFLKAINKALPVTAEIRTESISQPATPEQSDFLYFRSDRKMAKVYLKEIRYVESLKDYIKIVMEKSQVITKYSMMAMEAMLPEGDFIRIHRSFIVPHRRLISFTATHVQLENLELPIGKIYQREVLKKLESARK